MYFGHVTLTLLIHCWFFRSFCYLKQREWRNLPLYMFQHCSCFVCCIAFLSDLFMCFFVFVLVAWMCLNDFSLLLQCFKCFYVGFYVLIKLLWCSASYFSELSWVSVVHFSFNSVKSITKFNEKLVKKEKKLPEITILIDTVGWKAVFVPWTLMPVLKPSHCCAAEFNLTAEDK